MTHIESIDLDPLLETYAVANTPMFLLRKLATHPATGEVSQFSSNEILSTLRRRLKQKPQDAADYLLPYVCLVALNRRRDLHALKAARALKSPYHHWFKICADALVEGFQATTLETLVPHGSIGVSASTFVSPTPSTSALLTIKRS